jgi:isopentenyl-diphosphate delta-isomerase
MAREEIVSSVNEQLILVDEFDREIGAMPKGQAHEGKGTLHRAFSIFVFNENDELLLQQRSAQKPLWPEYWSNTCCSHPRVGETMDVAIMRRLEQELGFECPLHYLYKFKYQANFGTLGGEHEFCWVYYGRYGGHVDANVSEIADWRYISVDDLEAELADTPERFTPWFKMEWVHIRKHFLDQIMSTASLTG